VNDRVYSLARSYGLPAIQKRRYQGRRGGGRAESAEGQDAESRWFCPPSGVEARGAPASELPVIPSE
jgi:hypothetical protein